MLRSIALFCLATICMIILLIPLPVAHSETMTWSFNNNTDSTANLRFFDLTNNLVWPGNQSNVYYLEPNDSGHISLNCTLGEHICYGGEPESNRNRHWGAGIKGSERCNHCCFTCDSLNDPPPVTLGW